mmetsp:Transcript_11078/g.22938  ORF Transcript_11078/g.22938 Transcript_11078/m.22938 type:complete len:421 (+) Transcript_11078:68-1330(+)
MGVLVKDGTAYHRDEHLVAGSTCGPAFPAGALLARLPLAGESPTWADYLPLSLHPALQTHRCAPYLGSACVKDLACASKACSNRFSTGCGELASECCAEVAEAEEAAEQPVASAWWSGRVWSLSRDPAGCREVQAALEAAGSEEERQALAGELRGRVSEALRCPHANFVLQKCIAVIRPRNLQFIVDEILFKGAGAVAHVARHKYGCRIIQRLLEHLSPAQLHGLVDDLLEDAMTTCKHPYGCCIAIHRQRRMRRCLHRSRCRDHGCGRPLMPRPQRGCSQQSLVALVIAVVVHGNYVMQHLLEYGTARQRHELIHLLTQNAATVGKDSYACEVIVKAIALGAREDQVALARAFLTVPGFGALMARSQRGHASTKLILRALEGPEQEAARCQLSTKSACLQRASRRTAEQQPPRRGRRSQ